MPPSAERGERMRLVAPPDRGCGTLAVSSIRCQGVSAVVGQPAYPQTGDLTVVKLRGAKTRTAVTNAPIYRRNGVFDPIPLAEHELHAARLAVAMRERFTELAATWRKRGYELGLPAGIAVGHATLGRMDLKDGTTTARVAQ